MTRILALVAAGIVASAAMPRAQTVDRTSVWVDAERKLKSEDPRELAWGAFQAAEFQLTELVPDLIAAMSQRSTADSTDDWISRSALLDSAIRLRARVPVSTLRPYWRPFPIQTAILMSDASGSGKERLLVDVLGSADGFEWFAAANLLLAMNSRSVAAAILPSMRMRLNVTVSDDGGTISGSGAGAATYCRADAVAIGFPPLASYSIEVGPAAGHVVLSVGPRTTYYSRSVRSHIVPTHRAHIAGPTDRDRIDYIRALLNAAPSDRRLDLTERHVAVAWSGADAFVARVSAEREGLVADYGQLLAVLVAAGRLTVDDALVNSSPRVDVIVRDVRQHALEAIPPVP